MEAAYIYFKAKDERHVSIRSRPFLFIDHDRGSGRSQWDTEIDFGQGQRLTVADGESKDITLHFRSPEPRAIRFVDDANHPVTDIVVSAYMFWSYSNHCGVLAGADPLVTRMRPTPAGIVTVPDGDFEYAFEVHGRHLFVEDPSEPTENGFFTAYLTTPERLVRIHRFQSYTVSLQVFVGDEPAAGAELTGTVIRCGCPVCSGPAGKLDSTGRITLREYYPEENALCLVDDEGHSLWELSRVSPIDTVRLPAGTKIAVGYCR
jgi:hypothetical protein